MVIIGERFQNEQRRIMKRLFFMTSFITGIMFMLIVKTEHFNLDYLAGGLEKIAQKSSAYVVSKPLQDYFDTFNDFPSVIVFKNVLSKKSDIAKKIVSCGGKCVKLLVELTLNDMQYKTHNIEEITQEIEHDVWKDFTQERIQSRLTLKPKEDLLDAAIQNENLKIAWNNLKKKDVASFYKAYQNNQYFFDTHLEARIKLITDLENALRPTDPTKFDLTALNVLKEKIDKDLGYFIGYDKYLFEHLKNNDEQKAFALFLKTKEGKPFKDALADLLFNKSTVNVPEVLKIVDTIIPYITGNKKSKLWRDPILATLQGTLANAQKKLQDPNFYVVQPTKELLKLIQMFIDEFKDPEFAYLLSDPKNIRFASFLSSPNNSEARAFLHAITRPDEIGNKKFMARLHAVRDAIDADVAYEIVESYFKNDNKISQFIARINKGFNVGQLKQQWPWSSQEEETEEESEEEYA